MPPDDDSGVSSLPVDPNTGVPILTIAPPSSNPLPVVTEPTSDPYTGVTYPTSSPLVDTDQTSGPLAKLFGLAGNERYQTWPEKMVRSALTAPADALAGNLTPEQEIPRALDMASLAGGGAITEAPAVAAAPVSDSVGNVASLLHEFSMAAQPVLRSDTSQPATAIDAAANVPTFYSAVENAVNNASIKSASPQQWLGTIQNAKGVKPEELQWTGLQDWLADQNGPVTKQQVQDFVASNKVQLQEVNKGQGNLNIEPNEEEPHILQVYRADDPTGEHSGMVGEIIKDENSYTVNVPTLPKRNFTTQQEAEDFIKQNTDFGAETKHHQYQLPGGTNYREKILTLPRVENGATKAA